jgi:hypothetical protein
VGTKLMIQDPGSMKQNRESVVKAARRLKRHQYTTIGAATALIFWAAILTFAASVSADSHKTPVVQNETLRGPQRAWPAARIVSAWPSVTSAPMFNREVAS